MTNDLRQQVKLLKVIKNITYKEIALVLGIKPNSFYNWMRGEYELSNTTECKLKNIVRDLMQ